jgi:hypothetical protein
MAGQRKLKDQELLTSVLRETPAQLSSRYIRLCKKLHKKIKLARNCGIIAGEWQQLIPQLSNNHFTYSILCMGAV